MNTFGFGGIIFDILGASFGMAQSLICQILIRRAPAEVTIGPLKDEIQQLMREVSSQVNPLEDPKCRLVGKLLERELAERRPFWVARRMSWNLPSDTAFRQHFQCWGFPSLKWGQAKTLNEVAIIVGLQWPLHCIQTVYAFSTFIPVMVMALGIIFLLLSVALFVADTQNYKVSYLCNISITAGVSLLLFSPHRQLYVHWNEKFDRWVGMRSQSQSSSFFT